MSEQHERVNMTVGRDYNSASAYEYVIQTPVGDPANDDWRILARKGGFRSSATARRVGAKVAETFRGARPALDPLARPCRKAWSVEGA